MGCASPLLLFYRLEWSIEEIARHLAIQPGAVKTRLCRARQTLHRILTRKP